MIPGWDKFQHYRDRRPVWIKDYPDQLDREEYRALSPTARALLQDVRRLCALSGGLVRTTSVGTRVGMRLKREHWKELTDAGFVVLSASKPLAHRYQVASPEVEREKETPKPPSAKNRKPKVKTTGWRLVRGSHGQTHIPDPNGTDKPPAEARP